MEQDVAVLLTVGATGGPGPAAGPSLLRAVRPDLQVVVLAESPPEEQDALSWRAATRSVSAPVVLAVPDAALAEPEEVRGALEAVASHAPPGSRDLPTLVPYPGTPRWVIAAYLRDVLRAPDQDPVLLSHAGGLALQAARLTAESLDPSGHQVRVTARVSMPHGLRERPPWQFRLGIRQPDGTASAWSAPTPLQPRRDWGGAGQWERLVAEVPLHRLPTGTYELVIELADDPHPGPRPLRPSIGAVTPGRVRKMTWRIDRRRGSTRYLAFNTSTARVTQLAVQQRARGRRAALAWRLRRLDQDLRHVAHGRGGRRVRLLLLTRLLTRPIFRRSIWLVGERPESGQDNGLHLFRHLRREHPERHVYYVMERRSPEYRSLRRLGNVVAHSSWRHQLLMLHADVLADAFSIRYLLPRSWNGFAYNYHLAWRIGALRVFLQHGVHVSPSALQRMTTGYDIVITSAAAETQALREVSGYDEQLVETGLPRYDALTPGRSDRTVLFLTTWRRYLPSRVFAGQERHTDDFEGSAYQRFTTALLDSPRLHTILERHDHRMVFLPHHNLADQFHGVRPASDRVEVVEPSGDDIQRLVRTCDVFLTDHSSVHFDAAYLGKPVIYARFDREEYEARHAAPSWFDFQRDGFGPVTETLEETLDELERVLAEGCRQEEVYRERVGRVLTHHDGHNSRRVTAAIEARLEQRREELR